MSIGWNSTEQSMTRVDSIDGQRILGGHVSDFLLPNYCFNPERVAALDITKYRAQCSQAIDHYRERKLIDLPGIEAYRDTAIEQMQDQCAYGEALIRGFHGTTWACANTRRQVHVRASSMRWRVRSISSVCGTKQSKNCVGTVDVTVCKDKLRAEASKPNGDGSDFISPILIGQAAP